MAENVHAHAKCSVLNSVSGECEAYPLCKGMTLTGEQEEKAAKWIKGINSEYVAPLLAFGIEDEEVYPKSMLDKSVGKSLTPAKWSTIVGKKESKSKEMVTLEFCHIITKISSLPASSA